MLVGIPAKPDSRLIRAAAWGARNWLWRAVNTNHATQGRDDAGRACPGSDDGGQRAGSRMRALESSIQHSSLLLLLSMMGLLGLPAPSYCGKAPARPEMAPHRTSTLTHDETYFSDNRTTSHSRGRSYPLRRANPRRLAIALSSSAFPRRRPLLLAPGCNRRPSTTALTGRRCRASTILVMAIGVQTSGSARCIWHLS